MAGIRSNQAYAQLGKQASKGAQAATFLARSYLASDDRVAPRAEFAQFPETDTSRDAPDSEKMASGSEGSLAFGVRDSIAHRLLQAPYGVASLGTVGTTNYTHTLTPQAALDYWSIQQMLGATLYETFLDSVCNEFTINVEAGGFMTMSYSWMGRSATRSASEFGTLIALPTDPVYNFNDATVTLGGGATSAIRSFSMTMSNNLAMQQTDDQVPYDIHVGQREITGSFEMIFENLLEYNRFHYGATNGTTQSPTQAVTDILFSFSKGVNNSIDFDFDSINYEEFAVAPSTGGDPIVVPVRFRLRRAHATNHRVIVKNQVAT